jgi:hypothetical protein
MNHRTDNGSPTAEKVTPAFELAARWNTEALRHERAADEHWQNDNDEERLLHLEVARVLRNCARELSAVPSPTLTGE